MCPCTNIRNTPPPSVPGFIGDDYFCDTGCANRYSGMVLDVVSTTPAVTGTLHHGSGREISPPTSDDIEMRLCTDEDESNENVYIMSMEIYVM